MLEASLRPGGASLDARGYVVEVQTLTSLVVDPGGRGVQYAAEALIKTSSDTVGRRLI